MKERPYSYAVLQYLHDPSTYEFVNVGVLMVCPARDGMTPFVVARARTTVGRMRDFFPISAPYFRALMQRVNRRMEVVAKKCTHEDLFSERLNAAQIAEDIVPRDSSSLQWSRLSAGVTDNPQATFYEIYHRMVTKYDNKQAARKSDEEVWRPVRQELARRDVPINLSPKTISSKDDKIEFQHAWKNGKWHVYEPISLDLADTDGIYRKVHRWLGQLTSVVPEANEDFVPYFIVGAPTNPHLHRAYEKAISILSKAPGELRIFTESQISDFADVIEDEYRKHTSSIGHH